jgi:dTDP-4-amino-4,6-dideoxygalactose transaminase
MNSLNDFESLIANFFGAKYAVSTDCCTHAIELCLRLKEFNNVTCPNHTYLSVPMTFSKLGLTWKFNRMNWEDYYYIGNTNVIDAAVLWKENSYIPGTLMCLSFQFKKHLSLGRGGMILLDNEKDYTDLKAMVYDGRERDIPWGDQNISKMGYHYYMTPEIAEEGIKKFNLVKNSVPKKWSYLNYPNLQTMKVFKDV